MRHWKHRHIWLRQVKDTKLVNPYMNKDSVMPSGRHLSETRTHRDQLLMHLTITTTMTATPTTPTALPVLLIRLLLILLLLRLAYS